MSKEKRQLAAILFADISGYTALMQEDESGASKLLFKFQETLKEQVAKHSGKIINFYGDGCLAIFDSPSEAVKCGGSLQIIFQQNPKVPVRIGLHTGEVVFKDDNIYGDTVNLTSRIESIGVPGAVLFSEEINLAIKNQEQFKIALLGRFNFKNIKQSVKVYALANKEFIVPRKSEIKGKLKEPNKSRLAKATEKAKSVLAILGILVVLAAFNFPQLKGFFLNAFGETSLKDKRVAVMFFENETGDPSFDGVGKMAADWITQQLMDIENTKVVLPSNVRNNIHLAKASMEGIQEFAKATGAEVIINGRYYQSGDKLILQSQVINAQTREVVHVLNQPIIGDKTDPLPLIQEVSQRITGFWAVQDRKQFADRPPKLPAYREYLEVENIGALIMQKWSIIIKKPLP